VPYELFEGADGLDAVRDSWERLESHSPAGVFQTYEFCRLWFDTVGSHIGARPLIVTLSENGEPHGVFPACVVPYGPVRMLTWLSGPLVVGSGDILWSGRTDVTLDAFMREALARLRRRAGVAALYLTNVRADARAFPYLAENALPYKRGASPYIEIRGEFDEYFAALSRDVRRSVGRRWRRLAETGEVRFEVLGPGDPPCGEAAKLLVDFSRDRHGVRAERDNALGGHYAALRVAQACGAAHGRLARLTLDGRTIALQLFYLYRDRADLAIFAFDPEFSAFSPGKLLLRSMVEECFRQGLNVLDLGEGSDSYKYEWTSSGTSLTTFTSHDLLGKALCAVGNRQRRSRDETSS